MIDKISNLLRSHVRRTYCAHVTSVDFSVMMQIWRLTFMYCMCFLVFYVKMWLYRWLLKTNSQQFSKLLTYRKILHIKIQMSTLHHNTDIYRDQMWVVLHVLLNFLGIIFCWYYWLQKIMESFFKKFKLAH